MEKKYLKITPPKGEGSIVVVPYSTSTEAFYKARNITLEADKSDKRYKVEEASDEDITKFNPLLMQDNISEAEKQAAEKAKAETEALQAKLDEAEKAKIEAEKQAAEKAKALENELNAAKAELKKIQDEKTKK